MNCSYQPLSLVLAGLLPVSIASVSASRVAVVALVCGIVPPVDNPEAYEVKSTPQNGYIVVFRATGAPISPTDKRFTQIEAIAWANNHNKQAFTS